MWLSAWLRDSWEGQGSTMHLNSCLWADCGNICWWQASLRANYGAKHFQFIISSVLFNSPINRGLPRSHDLPTLTQVINVGRISTRLLGLWASVLSRIPHCSAGTRRVGLNSWIFRTLIWRGKKNLLKIRHNVIERDEGFGKTNAEFSCHSLETSSPESGGLSGVSHWTMTTLT